MLLAPPGLFEGMGPAGVGAGGRRRLFAVVAVIGTVGTVSFGLFLEPLGQPIQLKMVEN